ncbi:adenylate/guanylate cyclase domain-containing protein [Deltaproteobacteria bacterium TL4]
MLALFFTHQSELLRQGIEQLNQRLSQIQSMKDIKVQLQPFLFEKLSAAQFSMLWLSSRQQQFFGWMSQNTRHAHVEDGVVSTFEKDQSLEINATRPLLTMFQHFAHPVSREVLEEWILTHEIVLSSEDPFRQAELIQPVYFKEQLTCLLLLGPKIDDSLYTETEKDCLHQLGLLLGPYIENAKLMQGLEERVEERTQEMKRIQKVIQIVNSTLELDTVMAIVITELMEIFNFRQVLIHELIRSDRETAHTLKFLKAYGSMKKNLGKFQLLMIPVEAEGSLFSEAVHKKNFVHLSQIYPQWLETMDSRDRAFYDLCPFKSILIYPLEVQGNVIGTITFANTHQAFQVIPEDLQRISNYLTQVATAINNARMVQETRDTHERLDMIHRIGQIVSAHLELEKTTSVFIEEAVKAIYSEGSGSVFLHQPESNTLQLYASYGLNINYAQAFKLQVSPESMYTYSCFRDKTSKIFENKELGPYQNEDLLKIHFGRSAIQQLVVPLVSRNESIGLITLSHYHPFHQFSKGDQTLLENITLNITHHFENAQSYKAIQAKEQEIAHINQVVQTVNSTLDLNQVIKSVMAALLKIFEFNRIGIYLVEPQQKELVCHRYYGEGITEEKLKLIRQIFLPLRNFTSTICETFINKAPAYISPITPALSNQFFPADSALYKIEPVNAYLMCPLHVQNEVMGTIIFAHTQKIMSVTEEKIKTIQRYITQIATAINNVQLYDELKNTKIQLAESEKVAGMTRTFEKFVPTQFLKRISGKGIENIELGTGGSETLTIMFSDIRSFTSLSEILSPQELLNFLNAYFERMNAPIHEHHGFIDKFIGDAIMALFDRPGETLAEQVQDSIQAAIAMQQALQTYNQHRHHSGYRPIATGIGIHTGPVVFGTVGSAERMESTVLGDSVNLAARLESLTKSYGTPILISSDTFHALKEPERFCYRELDWVRVKGKTRPVGFYEIFDADPPEIRELKKKSTRDIRRGLYSRFDQDWQNAIQSFQKALDLFPEDQVTQLHLQRCQPLQGIELPEDWDGAIVLEEK